MILDYFKNWVENSKQSFYGLFLIVIPMLIAPFCYNYFSEEYVMAKDEVIGFTIYFIVVGGAFISLTTLGYLANKKSIKGKKN